MADALAQEYSPSALDFTGVTAEESVEHISRPSLSYWQDAWIRLKKNTRAIISLYIVIALAIFTLIGPLVWRVNPALQDLGQISQSPSLPKKALVVPPFHRWNRIVLDDFPAQPGEYSTRLPAPTGLRTWDEPTTQRVRPVFPAMTLPAPGSSPPTVFPGARSKTPVWLGTAAVPVTSVPM